jgi:prepilin-type N-terminal cleavage/methylation domain-containing protein
MRIALKCRRNSRGFTLIETLISLSLGLVVVGSALQVFKSSLDATSLVQQRAEMQQDLRAASNLLRQDISLAGAGLPGGGVQLASGTALAPKLGCDQTQCYVNNSNGITYPGNWIYGIVPGWQKGITLDAPAGATDTITLAYTDNTFLLNCYTATFNNTNGTQVTFTLPSPLPSNCTGSNPQLLSDPVLGLKTGDFVLFQNKTNGSTAYALGEITQDVAGKASPFTVNFASPDASNLNQTNATAGDMKQIATGVNTVAWRLNVITYYLQLCTTCGSKTPVPMLMRQISGHSPIPVADNVSFLQFTYETYDVNGNLLSGAGDAGISQGVSPSEIRSVNIVHLSMRNPVPRGKTYQGTDVATTVSARNMSFSNRYQ